MDEAAARRQRVIGAVVGSVVGDALGAPFEFGPPGRFSGRFPAPWRGLETEMCGGGPWAPGEWTDDTQMALLVAASLLEGGGLDEADLFDRFRSWVAAGPADVGVQTRQVLCSGDGWRDAARRYFAAGHRAAGNGSLMRTTPAAVFFSRAGAEATVDAARRISDLTHGDPAAGDGCAIFHLLVAAALNGGDPLDVLGDALGCVPADRRGEWQRVLAPEWDPHREPVPNGAVWPTLGTAVWALRRYSTFESAMRDVIDVGGDTDTIAAVAGGLLGATYGIQAIPSRWASAVNGVVPGHYPIVTDLASLQELALRLDGERPAAEPACTDGVDPVEVAPGLWLTDLDGAARAREDAVIISLCRTFGRIGHRHRRHVYLTDDGNNLDLDAVLTDVIDAIEALRAEGHPVVIHCQGGASRTGLVLRAWLCRTQGLTAVQATREAQRLWPRTATWNDSFGSALAKVGSTH